MQPPKAKTSDYVGAVFGTLLVVGFTFKLPMFLYVPLVFFCIAAGILFFKDMLWRRHQQKPGPVIGQPGQIFIPNSDGTGVTVVQGATFAKRQRSPVVKILLGLLIGGGVFVIGYIGYIALMLIALGIAGV